MEHSLKNLLQFTTDDLSQEKYKRIHAFHYDHSGHVVTTNSHVLFATKRPWEITKAGRTFSKTDYEKGKFLESELEFPKWKDVIPTECGRKATISIPRWFEIFSTENTDAIFILDYSDIKKPFFKLSDRVGETCLAFNAKYLSCFAGEEISLLIKSQISPIVIIDSKSQVDPHTKHFKDDVLKEEWFYVLMPIQLDEENSTQVYM